MPQELDEGIGSYLGRSHQPRVGYGEKSAEVIVVVETSQYREGKGVEIGGLTKQRRTEL